MLNLGAQCTPPKVDRVPHIPMLKESNPRKGFFEPGDFAAVRDALPSYLKGMVTFAYKTGWRKEEVTDLQWTEVDLDRGIVKLNPGETKNDEGRTVTSMRNSKKSSRHSGRPGKQAGRWIPMFSRMKRAQTR